MNAFDKLWIGAILLLLLASGAANAGWDFIKMPEGNVAYLPDKSTCVGLVAELMVTRIRGADMTYISHMDFGPDIFVVTLTTYYGDGTVARKVSYVCSERGE